MKPLILYAPNHQTRTIQLTSPNWNVDLCSSWSVNFLVKSIVLVLSVPFVWKISVCFLLLCLLVCGKHSGQCHLKANILTKQSRSHACIWSHTAPHTVETAHTSSENDIYENHLITRRFECEMAIESSKWAQIISEFPFGNLQIFDCHSRKFVHVRLHYHFVFSWQPRQAVQRLSIKREGQLQNCSKIKSEFVLGHRHQFRQ